MLVKISKLSIPFLSCFLAVRSLFACDLCGCYTVPIEAVYHNETGLYSGLAEQFTYLGSLRDNGHEVANPTNQFLASSTTQLIAGYGFLDHRLSLQINVPFIYRDFKRPEGFEIDRGHESGVGDISFLGNYRLFRHDTPDFIGGPVLAKDGKSLVVLPSRKSDFTVSINVIAGVKFPTGDASRLKEEFHETEVEGAPESGIHGHDLALGTGSYDAIFGGDFYLRYQSFYFQADAQFTLRGDGRYSYHFANDLTWSAGPGWYLIRSDNRSLGLQFAASGEYKDTDRFQGRVAEDTGLTAVYLGPRMIGSIGPINAEVGLDLPILLDNTALQVVPDYRIRAAFTVHF